MLKAYRGNRVLRIPDEKKKDYVALGYRITDMGGNVLYDPVNNSDNVKELKAALAEKESEIEELKTASGARMDLFNSIRNENKELKATMEEKDKIIEELTAKVAESEKPEKKTTGAGKTEK